MLVQRYRRSALVMVAVVALIGSAAHRWLTNGLIESQAEAAESQPVTAESQQFSPYVDELGKITLPADYKTTFTHLGSFATASKVGGEVDQMHGVYARPEDVEAYQKDGKFPDGAVIVKDVYKTKSDNLTTGTVTWATDIDIWFVMVKDTKGRFKENDLWGDGWGWALFKGTDPEKQVATDYSTDCRSCHVPAKKDDWLYVRGYPVLGGKRETK